MGRRGVGQGRAGAAAALGRRFKLDISWEHDPHDDASGMAAGAPEANRGGLLQITATKRKVTRPSCSAAAGAA